MKLPDTPRTSPRLSRRTDLYALNTPLKGPKQLKKYGRQKTLHEVLRRANTRRDIGQNVGGVHADRNYDIAERGKDTAECQPVFEYGREAAREDITPNKD